MLKFRNTVEVVRVHRGIEYRHYARNAFTTGGPGFLRDRLLGLNSQAPLGAASRLDITGTGSTPQEMAGVLNTPLVEGRSTFLTGGASNVYYFSLNTGNVDSFVQVNGPLTLHLKPAESNVGGMGAWYDALGTAFQPQLTALEADQIYNVEWRVTGTLSYGVDMEDDEEAQVRSILGFPEASNADQYQVINDLIAGVGGQGHFASCRMRLCKLTDVEVTRLRNLRDNPTIPQTNADSTVWNEWDTTNPAIQALPTVVMEAAETRTGMITNPAGTTNIIRAELEIPEILDGNYKSARWYAIELVPTGAVTAANRRAIVALDYLDERRSQAFGENNVNTRLVTNRPGASDVTIDIPIA